MITGRGSAWGRWTSALGNDTSLLPIPSCQIRKLQQLLREQKECYKGYFSSLISTLWLNSGFSVKFWFEKYVNFKAICIFHIRFRLFTSTVYSFVFIIEFHYEFFMSLIEKEKYMYCYSLTEHSNTREHTNSYEYPRLHQQSGTKTFAVRFARFLIALHPTKVFPYFVIINFCFSF